MYVGWTLIILGISLIADNIWILLFLIMVVLYTSIDVILKEEHYLEEHFSDQYRKY